MELGIPWPRNRNKNFYGIWAIKKEVKNAEATVKKIEYHFYNGDYVNYYINYDNSLQQLRPHGAVKWGSFISKNGYADDVPTWR